MIIHLKQFNHHINISSAITIKNSRYVIYLLFLFTLNINRSVCLAIINSTNWKDSLKNETINEKTGYRDTPMRKLIRKMPGLYMSLSSTLSSVI